MHARQRHVRRPATVPMLKLASENHGTGHRDDDEWQYTLQVDQNQC